MNVQPFLAFVFIRLMSFTYRYKIINQDHLNEVKNRSLYGNYLFGLWHQNLIGAILSQLNNPHAVVVSSSKDGELVAKTCEWLGHKSTRGSSSRGGTGAMKGMIKLLRSGLPGALTVDGPRGPMHEAKKGIFELSYLTKTPVVPLAILPNHFWEISNAWDKFRIPKPFATFYIHFGEPIYPSNEDKQHQFERSVKDLKQRLHHSEAYLLEMMKKK